ncbi:MULTISPECIES: hypothetical protein [unclassified Acinetobacter]|uniref:hypothetical protein n=1 Tax=unclassified Acinetobacter TaxID=196816 RepID=UPI002578B6DC|nr:MULTISPECIES: hypothetical protein [unclassified Acinetobacter]MDM1764575.1 hypothetical protein [Acinetobacter sp. 226-1]MDM1767550.1 hypothetical protein [Acinetobacter sp. 226-4]
MELNLKQFKKRIEEFKSTGNKPNSIVIGYKTYANLMEEEKFVDHISKDVDDPMVRYYKGIQIKMITEKHYLEIK